MTRAAAHPPDWRCAKPALTLAARHAAALFAVDPAGLGGVVIRGLPGPTRDGWLDLLARLLPAGTPMRRVPLHINDERLLGGLDLAATLNAGRPMAQQGVLTLADGGVVLMAMAERLSPSTAARLAAVLDTGEVAIERDGLASRHASRIGVVALDEGLAEDERVSAVLLDRLAFVLDLHPVLDDDGPEGEAAARFNDEVDALTDRSAADIAAARALLPAIEAGDEVVQVLVSTALALGIASLRAPLLALRVARAAAALDGRTHITDDDVKLSAALVLAPRATQIPTPPQPPESADAPPDAPPEPPADAPAPPDEAPPPEPDSDTDNDDPPPELPVGELEDLVLAAVQAAIPADLLAALKTGLAPRSSAQASGRAGALQKGTVRGRPTGARRGEPRAGARLNLIETLRAAAPWQRIRRAEVERARGGVLSAADRQRVQVRRDDFHVTRYQQRRATTTVFVVDASGSSALNRLAEAKGAVELLLADCYVRRDQVAVLAFRGRSAELLLPPTRSLVRAKRSLAGLPGGGGTPLASGIDAAAALATSVARRGETPLVVLLTDGRGNIARDGSPGRTRAAEDVQLAARQFRAFGYGSLLIDTSPQPQAAAKQLAVEMGATYLPLPFAGSSALSKVVAQAAQSLSAPSTGRPA